MLNWLLYQLGKFIALVLPLKATYGLVTLIGHLQFYFSRKDRESVIFNHSRVLPENDEKTIKKIALSVFINFGKHLADFFRFSRVNEEFIKENVDIVNLEYLSHALKAHPGVIVLTAHLGNWELGGAIVARLGFPFYAVALSHTHEKVTQFFNTQRALCGVKVIPVGFALKKCYRLLKTKNIVALLGDKDFNGSGVVLDFCSGSALIPRGPAFFALRTGAVIMPAFALRNNQDRLSLIFEKPIVVKNEHGDLKAENDLINEYTHIIEKYVLQYPEQWYMFQPFFRT